MKNMTWFENKLAKFEKDLDFITEEAIIEFNEKIVEKMKERGLNNTKLAKLMGVSKPFVSKLLNGNPNMTLKTMVNIAEALDCNIYIDVCNKWVEPKTLYLLNKGNYKQFSPNTEGLDYAIAA